LTVGITVLGEVPPGAALRRSGACAGDDLWVSHSRESGLGDARLALEVFRGQVQLSGESFSRVRRAMEWPQPRVALGVALRGTAHAAIDLSDGLAGDLGHVLAQSRVGALLEWAALPRSDVLSAQPLPLQKQCVLGGGDDYELLFSASASARAAVQRAAAQAEVAVSRVGEIQSESGLRVRWPDGVVTPWAARGFDHFASDAP
jgi:thiamine-monophosphate kinase